MDEETNIAMKKNHNSGLFQQNSKTWSRWKEFSVLHRTVNKPGPLQFDGDR